MPETPEIPDAIPLADEAAVIAEVVASTQEGEPAEIAENKRESEETPVIDIHAPHGGLHTWKNFWIHLGTITLGLLIAISLEQSVEYLHHRQLAAEARRALAQERRADETANDFNIFATRRHEQDLQQDLAVLEAVRAHRSLPPGPFIVRHADSLYADEAWQNIRQSGTINYLGGNIAGGLRFRHTVEDEFTESLNRSRDELARAASVLRTSTDPPTRIFEHNVAFADFFRRFEDAHENLPQQQVDAAWATMAEPGNVAALNPAQIDDFERAIQIALAEDDAMLNDCFTIKRNLTRNPN